MRDALIKENGGLNGKLKNKLNAKQELVLETIRKQQGISVRNIVPLLNIPIDTVDKIIKFLIKNGYIERRGSRKTGGYFIKEN